MYTRRNFVKKSLILTASAGSAHYILAACGSTGTSGSGGGLGTAGNCSANGATYTVALASGHSHSGNAMTATDISTGHAGPYGMGSSGGHTHNVFLTAAQITALQANEIIDVESDDNGAGHTHTVRITCS